MVIKENIKELKNNPEENEQTALEILCFLDNRRRFIKNPHNKIENVFNIYNKGLKTFIFDFILGVLSYFLFKNSFMSIIAKIMFIISKFSLFFIIVYLLIILYTKMQYKKILKRDFNSSIIIDEKGITSDEEGLVICGLYWENIEKIIVGKRTIHVYNKRSKKELCLDISISINDFDKVIKAIKKYKHEDLLAYNDESKGVVEKNENRI